MSDVLGSVKFPTNSTFGTYYDNLNRYQSQQMTPRVRYHDIILEEDSLKKDKVPATKSPSASLGEGLMSPFSHFNYFKPLARTSSPNVGSVLDGSSRRRHSGSVSPTTDSTLLNYSNNISSPPSSNMEQSITSNKFQSPHRGKDSEFEYKKYMKLLRSNSIGSISDIHGTKMSLTPIPPTNPIVLSPFLLPTQIKPLTNGYNSSTSKLDDATPSFERKKALRTRSTRNSLHQRNNQNLFRTITDIDIGENRLSNDDLRCDSKKSTSSGKAGKFKRNNSLLRRNSIAFGSNFGQLETLRPTDDGSNNKNGIANSVLCMNGIKYCSTDRNDNNKANNSKDTFASINNNSERKLMDSLIPNENWRIICDNRGILLENNIPMDESSNGDKRMSKSEFDEVTRNIHKLLERDDDSGKDFSNSKISNNPQDSNSLLVNESKRRNSVGAPDKIYSSDHAGDRKDKFIFGTRRNKLSSNISKPVEYMNYRGETKHTPLSVEEIIKSCHKNIKNKYDVNSNRSASNGAVLDIDSLEFKHFQKFLHNREVLDDNFPSLSPIEKHSSSENQDTLLSGITENYDNVDSTYSVFSEESDGFRTSNANSLNELTTSDGGGPRAARVSHSFGLKNFQNVQKPVPSSTAATNDDNIIKVFPQRKLTRRMTTSGLMRPAIQKFVALGTQKFLRKQDHKTVPECEKLLGYKVEPINGDFDKLKTENICVDQSYKEQNMYENSSLNKSSSPLVEDFVENATVLPPVLRPPRRNKKQNRAKKKSANTDDSSNFGGEINRVNCHLLDKSNCVKKKINKVREKMRSVAPSHFSHDKIDFQTTTSEENEHGLITIQITPDISGKFAGKFGFNVKGGCDQETPVLVSKVTAGSPADTCYPRLNEGDQVLLINGREVSSMTHEQVVNSIKASKECHSGELVLTVKQNVYEPDVSNEPEIRFVPDSGQKMSEGNVSSSAEAKATSPPHQLKESMDLIETGLELGGLISRFENLHRRKPGLTMDIARLTKNKNRNRYGDISPYDTTRVILKNTTSPTTDTNSQNDYINASHVIMDVAGSGIRNAYIASQGPLSSTSPHFWQMIWEQKTNLVVMLTTVVEQGRSKCHQYWPEADGTAEYGNFSVLCKNKDTPSGFAVREFTLTNKLTKESRTVTHMQYLAWPDHGVPQHSTDFLTFIQRVRAIRAESESTVPTVVHCSAGIGRTGVLILMETAQCLMEANQPVDPVDLVETMRNQRAMMIQTSGQFRFVCEAICRVYSEKLIKPLEKYITAR